MLTIWFGRATIRPANGPDSKLKSAAKLVPDAACSGGIAWSEALPLGSAFGSVCCHTGITEVASSNDPASAGAPLVGAAPGDPDGQATRVELTSGVDAPAVCRSCRVEADEAMARSGAGSARGDGCGSDTASDSDSGSDSGSRSIGASGPATSAINSAAGVGSRSGSGSGKGSGSATGSSNAEGSGTEGTGSAPAAGG